MMVPEFLPGQRAWIDLLNAEATWVTDDALLELIPREARVFDDGPRWAKPRALAYVVNNVQALRASLERMESGELPDWESLNPVLESVRPQLFDWRAREDFAALSRKKAARGAALVHFGPALAREAEMNTATAHLRLVVQRAFWHFAQYAAQRLADPQWPGATPGLYRVFLVEEGSGLKTVVPSPAGLPPEKA